MQQVAEEEKHGATFSDLFTNSIFRDIVLSLAATIGLYVLASIIHVRGFEFEGYVWMDIDHRVLLDGPVAHDYLFCAVYSHRSLVHQHPERLCCKSRVFPSRLAAIDHLGTSSSRMSSELVVRLVESDRNLTSFFP